VFNMPSGQTSLQTVFVGDAGNAADTTERGAVGYNYRIGTYDVTNAQYAEFLNAKAATSDPYGLYNSNMGSDIEGGITQAGASGSYSFSVKSDYANKPVVFVSWYDTIRFSNWLTNGQGSGDTESGTYTITGGGVNSGTVVIPDAAQRAAWAASGNLHWLLPSESEWYKAAYYKGGSLSAGYWVYPFKSNTVPTTQAPPGDSNSANYYDNTTTGFAVTHSVHFDGSQVYLTDVGAYTSARSPYGAFDMGGNAWQWNEAIASVQSGTRQIRGGSWFNRSIYMNSDTPFGTFPVNESSTFGFRVASVDLTIGDMNGDGVANNFDIATFEQALADSAAYLTQYPTLTNYPQRGDVNHDGVFDNFDIYPFEVLLATGHYPGAAVPEPGSFALLTIGGAGFLLWARRRKASA